RCSAPGGAATRSFTGASVGVGALPADGQSAAVPKAPVATEVHEPLDVERHLAARVPLHLEVRVDDLADTADFVLIEVVRALVERNFRHLADQLGPMRAYSVNVLERNPDMLPTRKVDTGNTCHRLLPTLPESALPLLVAGILTD